MSSRRNGVLLVVLAVALTATAAAWAGPQEDNVPAAFVHGILIDLPEDGLYYLAGPDDGDGLYPDIPGHYWSQTGPYALVGRHYNSGPFGAPQWWSSDANDGRMLYVLDGVIAPWSPTIAEHMASYGYVHYHELISVSDGLAHPDKVLWLKHTAVSRFTLDGGPHPELTHEVTPGIDYDFIPNYFVPYGP